MSSDSNLPSVPEKPGLLDWLESHLPFKIPRIPLVQTAANLDKATAMIILAGGTNITERINSSTTRIKAKSDAERALIEFGQLQISNPASMELADRALQYAVGDAIRAQQNREQILRLTADDLSANKPEQDAADDIDVDWLGAFNKYAETKSNAEIQQLWAKILSSEIRKPGSTSLRTLDFLSTVSMRDAKRIVSIFTFALNSTFIPHWVHEEDKYSFAEFFSLQEIGIISGVYGMGGASTNIKAIAQPNRSGAFAVIVEYFEKVAIIETSDQNYCLKIPASFLTEIGRNLFAMTDTKIPDYGYLDEYMTQLGKDPITKISIATIASRIENGLRTIDERVIYQKA